MLEAEEPARAWALLPPAAPASLAAAAESDAGAAAGSLAPLPGAASTCDAASPPAAAAERAAAGAGSGAGAAAGAATAAGAGAAAGAAAAPAPTPATPSSPSRPVTDTALSSDRMDMPSSKASVACTEPPALSLRPPERLYRASAMDAPPTPPDPGRPPPSTPPAPPLENPATIFGAGAPRLKVLGPAKEPTTSVDDTPAVKRCFCLSSAS